MKELVLKRVPPGDNWKDANKKSEIFGSLTEGLEYVFKETGCKEYHLSAVDGAVYTVEEDAPVEPKKYNLYGE